MKKTAIAPSNIAFIKYWGKKNEKLRLPENASISMNLSNLLTTTTVEFNPTFKRDSVMIDNKELGIDKKRILEHIDRIRKMAAIKDHVRIVSENNFPSHTGLSSSASGFSALTVAAIAAAGLNISERELSILARLGSGSACRSIPNGLVEWLDGDSSDTSFAVSLYPKDYWDIVDVVVIVSTERKYVSTSEGQKLTTTSPFFSLRIARMSKKIKEIKKHMRDKNFTSFGELLEAEALELHSIMLTSTPSLLYLLPNTLRLISAVKEWRKDGIEVYFTLNTGQNIHLICEQKNAEIVAKKAQELAGVYATIINQMTNGAHLTEKHLF